MRALFKTEEKFPMRGSVLERKRTQVSCFKRRGKSKSFAQKRATNLSYVHSQKINHIATCPPRLKSNKPV
jgi:hypothetical protein